MPNKPAPASPAETRRSAATRHPLLVVISGTSGAGKDSVAGRLREDTDNFEFIVTVTSRKIRDGEVDGYDYIFVSEEKFEKMAAGGEFWEHADVYGQNKGVPRRHVEQALAGEKDILMRVDVQGAETIRRLTHNQAVTIFVDAPSLDDLEQRLRLRKTDSEDQILKRLDVARRERERLDEFDYLILNHEDCLDDTVEAIRSILNAEHHRVHPRKVSL
ncbi:MAG: guanylate kinase [Anaerolineae bacterium]|nr:MAG: guanylate kinase [Anaerolineae bacterium]